MATKSNMADDFPYKRLCGDMLADIGRRFIALSHWRPTFRKMNYRINNAPELQIKNLRFCFAGQCDPTIMTLKASDYEDYNLISDYFIEQYRIRAIRGDDPKKESVYDYWRAHRAELLETCSNGSKAEKLHCARELIYKYKMEVGTFRPTIAAGLVWMVRNLFGTPCNYVLDPCAGWGDRLIGIMASNVRGSVHVDPNPDLGAEYARIEQWARKTASRNDQEAAGSSGPPLDLTDYRREYFASPFEDIPRDDLLQALLRVRGTTGEGVKRAPRQSSNGPNGPNGPNGSNGPNGPNGTNGSPSFIARDDGFDLTIIAPPYFDLEIYVPNDVTGTQSITRFKTWEEWYEKFLIASLAKCASVLRVGGILALIINEPPDRSSPRFLARLGGDVIRAARSYHTSGQDLRQIQMRYLGVISYAEFNEQKHHIRSPQPIWLWMRERQ